MTTEEYKDTAITPEKIGKLVNEIASRNTVKSTAAYYDLQDIVEDVAEAYLKLHEENARLQAELNHYTATDHITAAKAYNLEMGLRHEAEKENTRLREEFKKSTELAMRAIHAGALENTRLQKISDKQREALEFYANEENYENGRPIIKSYPADGSNGIVSWVNIMITKGDNGITARNALKEQPK